MAGSSPTARSSKLDALRGLAAYAMILVNTQPRDASKSFSQLRHPEHLGLTLADLVMPAFGFAAGASIPKAIDAALSAALKETKDFDEARMIVLKKHILPRTLRLFALGFALGIPFSLVGPGSLRTKLERLRVWGVLQRHALVIGIAQACYLYLLAGKDPASIPWLRKLSPIVASNLIWLLVTYRLPFPNTPAPTTLFPLFPIERIADPQKTAAYYIDLKTVGVDRMYRRNLDPEGLLGTLSGLTNTYLGMLNALQPLSSLPLLFSALALQKIGIPISKRLWTPSFALLSTVSSLLVLDSVPILPFLVEAGRNNLPIYIVQSFLPHVLFIPGLSDYGERIRDGTVGMLPGGWQGVAWGGFWSVILVELGKRMRKSL